MKQKVLIVDDSQTIRKIIKTNLEKLNVRDVLEAGDGENGLRLLSANKDITLVFVDYNMPVMNGLNMVKKIRENSAFDNLKIVAISSSFDAALMSSFEQLNISGFIVKPFDIQNFNNTIKPILELPDATAGGGGTKEKGVPKEDVIRLFSSEKPAVSMNGRFVEFDFKNEKIKLEIDVISKYGSVYVELGE